MNSASTAPGGTSRVVVRRRTPESTPSGGSTSATTVATSDPGEDIMRQGVPGRRQRQRGQVGVDDGVEDGGHLPRLEVLELAVEPFEHLTRLGRVEGVGTQRAAQAAHDHRGRQAAAEDVPHDDAHPAGREQEHVVPVAAHAAGTGGQVAAGELETGDAGQAVGDQAALQGGCGGALDVGAPGFDGERDAVADHLDELDVVGLEPAGRHRSRRGAPR